MKLSTFMVVPGNSPQPTMARYVCHNLARVMMPSAVKGSHATRQPQAEDLKGALSWPCEATFEQRQPACSMLLSVTAEFTCVRAGAICQRVLCCLCWATSEFACVLAGFHVAPLRATPVFPVCSTSSLTDLT